MRETTIDRAQQGPLEAWSRFNPFNNLVRNVEMKSTDRKILILVASLALLLAGCGGGGPSTAPPDPGQTADMAIMDVKDALTAAEAAVSSAMTEDAKLAAYREVQRAADNLVAALTTHGGSEADIAAAAGKSGNAKAMADILARKIEDDAVAADAAMTALAAKLYAAMAPVEEDGRIHYFIYSKTVGTGIDDDTGVLTVHNISDNVPQTAAGPELKEDKSAMVPPLHGWTGSRHTATVAAKTYIIPGNSASGSIGAGTYTAHLYSNVEAPKQGRKFGGTTAQVTAEEVQYALTSGVTDPAATTQNGEITINTNTAAVQERVAFTGITRTAGTETFKFLESEVTDRRIDVPGSFHGVSGTYYCTPTARAAGCSASVAASGFTLEAGTWAFKPTDANDRVMSAPDTVYPVYGWWLHEALDGTTTVSPFTRYRGSLAERQAEIAILASGNFSGALANPLNGTATYKGGAAGIYALQSSTGGTNDAGHFTADAELRATFSTTGPVTGRTYNHKIEGTIDSFMGSDGMSRDWSVELKQITIGDSGGFDTFSSDGKTTTWSMGGTAASDSGAWEGDLYKQNDADVPTVGTGMFYSEYGNAGRMTGAFGVNLEE